MREVAHIDESTANYQIAVPLSLIKCSTWSCDETCDIYIGPQCKTQWQSLRSIHHNSIDSILLTTWSHSHPKSLSTSGSLFPSCYMLNTNYLVQELKREKGEVAKLHATQFLLKTLQNDLQSLFVFLLPSPNG